MFFGLLFEPREKDVQIMLKKMFRVMFKCCHGSKLETFIKWLKVLGCYATNVPWSCIDLRRLGRFVIYYDEFRQVK